MPNYTKIPQSFREEYKKKFLLTDSSEINRLAEEDPVIFAYYFLGKEVRLHQAYILDRIIKSKRINTEMGQRLAVCWARQLGKEQPYSANVLTPKGFVKMGNLKLDDNVIAADGTKSKITDIFEQGKKDVYKITFDDGAVAECGLEHLWKYQTKKQRATTSNFQVGTLKDIFNYLNPNGDSYEKYRPRYKKKYIAIPLCQPVIFDKKNLNIDPYVLGCLIGDGGLSCRHISFTSADDGIMDKLASRLPDTLKLRRYKRNNHYQCYIRSGHGLRNLMIEELRTLNLMGKKSKDKFIPPDYLISDVSDRIDLLRGLCDTDGSITEKGVIEYCTVSPDLAKDVQYLVHSLGGKCSVKFSENKFLGRYRLRIRLAKINPFYLKRKADRFVVDYGRSDVRFIWKIEKVRQEQSRCILIDNPEHLYLTDNFIVTHNSITLGIFVIWACWYNKYPTTISNITVIYISSKEDEAATDLMEKIKMILYDGDRYMSKFVGNDNYFTGSMKEPNNTHQFTFINNCFAKSIPPTMKAVGKSASWFLLDEAHRLRCTDMDPDSFFDFASVMVAETGGGIILSSTAEGIIGFFYRAIDPDNKYKNNEYEKFWFSHEIWDDGSPECIRYQAFVQSEKKRLTEAGRIIYWQQEYQALFTVTETAFFEHKDIEESLKDTPMKYEWKETPCSLGIDYGMTISRTVLTVRTMIKGEIIQIFQYRCPAGFDINLLTDPSWEHSIQNLKRRYNLFMILPDNCPQGDQTNKWLEKNSGIEVKSYNFRSDQMSKNDGINRNCAAYAYRSKLKEGKLKTPNWNKVQIFEMKIIQETEQKVLISIKAPTGQLCDTFDSDMMACIPFIDMQDVRDFECDARDDDVDEEPEKHGNKYDYFHSPTDDECREMIRQANEGLL